MQPLRQAQQLLELGRVEDAANLLRAIQAQGPKDLNLLSELNYLLGVAALTKGDAEQGLAYALTAARARPDEARYAFAVGRGCKAAGRPEHAIVAYRRAIALQPQFPEALVSLGIVHKQLGQVREAIVCYEQAIAIAPDLAVAHANLANARSLLAHQVVTAADSASSGPSGLEDAERACALAPESAPLHFNLGLMLLAAGRREAAIAAFDRALGLDPSNLAYCLRLGQELTRNGAAATAVAIYEGWLQSYPAAAAVCRALAGLLTERGAIRQAIASAEQALALEPDAKSHLQLCRAYQQGRRIPAALSAGLSALELSNDDPAYFSAVLLLANYALADPQPLQTLHAKFGRAQRLHQAPLQKRLPRAPLAAGRRLKVAYLSADFIGHSVSYFIEHLLEKHDPSRFEVWCLYNRSFGDVVTERFKALGHHWVDCADMQDDALYRLIQAAGIDVLVDLAGHTAGERLRLLAMAPASLQITYLGYPNVTGLVTVDARITDGVIDPQEDDTSDCEPPLRLPRSMFCYRPPAAPPIGPQPSRVNGRVTFGSFNNMAKLGDECLALWARVLLAVPGSQLLLKSSAGRDGQLMEDIARFMADRGVDPARVEVRPFLDDQLQHLATYNEVDIALDSFPFNGATTTCEALWMGVPVVSMRGQTRPSRMGASVLGAAGCPQWCVQSPDEFVALALALSCEDAVRQHWRDNARAVLSASELLDASGFVQAFESAIESAWQRMPPRS